MRGKKAVILKIWNHETEPWEEIGGLNEIQGPESTGEWKDKIEGLKNGGTVSFTVDWSKEVIIEQKIKDIAMGMDMNVQHCNWFERILFWTFIKPYIIKTETTLGTVLLKARNFRKTIYISKIYIKKPEVDEKS